MKLTRTEKKLVARIRKFLEWTEIKHQALADDVGVSKFTVIRLMNGLVLAGFVERQEERGCPNSYRCTEVGAAWRE